MKRIDLLLNGKNVIKFFKKIIKKGYNPTNFAIETMGYIERNIKQQIELLGINFHNSGALYNLGILQWYPQTIRFFNLIKKSKNLYTLEIFQ